MPVQFIETPNIRQNYSILNSPEIYLMKVEYTEQNFEHVGQALKILNGLWIY